MSYCGSLLGDPRLTERQKSILLDAEKAPVLSAASIFEISIKMRIGKLDVPAKYKSRLEDLYVDFDFRPLDIKASHAALAGQLVGNHNNPFDRLLAAQSIIEGMDIMTIDRAIGELGARVVW
jgi:PIN domain nuclease of toxin-antitoxin system